MPFDGKKKLASLVRKVVPEFSENALLLITLFKLATFDD